MREMAGEGMIDAGDGAGSGRKVECTQEEAGRCPVPSWAGHTYGHT